MAGPRPMLIVEDDAALRATLGEQIALDGEFSADEAGTASEAEQILTGAEAATTPSCWISACRTPMAATSAPSCGATARRCRSSC